MGVYSRIANRVEASTHVGEYPVPRSSAFTIRLCTRALLLAPFSRPAHMDAFVWRRQGPWWLEGSRAASAVASIPAPMTPVHASVQGRVASIVASAVTPASSTPVRCGELLCQKDSYARTLDTVVVSCEPKAAAAQEAAAKGKKKEA